MSEQATQMDTSMWFSTYGLLTSKRILERFNIHMDNDELIAAIKNPHCVYHQMLRVPLKNVFNGIIFQQAQDYQVYAQKLFIDYLLSGAGSKDEESPGANTRDDLEDERLQVIETGEKFHQQEIIHQQLIAESQARLIKLSLELKRALEHASKNIRGSLRAYSINKEETHIQKAIQSALVHYPYDDDEILVQTSSFWTTMADVLDKALSNEFRQDASVILQPVIKAKKNTVDTLTPYFKKTDEMGVQLRSYRRQFYDLILRATESIKFLPDYRVDETRENDNRSSLYFDSMIGGE